MLTLCSSGSAAIGSGSERADLDLRARRCRRASATRCSHEQSASRDAARHARAAAVEKRHRRHDRAEERDGGRRTPATARACRLRPPQPGTAACARRRANDRGPFDRVCEVRTLDESPAISRATRTPVSGPRRVTCTGGLETRGTSATREAPVTTAARGPVPRAASQPGSHSREHIARSREAELPSRRCEFGGFLLHADVVTKRMAARHPGPRLARIELPRMQVEHHRLVARSR